MLLVTAGLLLGACGPASPQGGPLEGSRVEADTITICAPGGKDIDVYFGDVLTNRGDRAVEITGVQGTELDDATVDYFVDLEGPSQGQLLGAFAWPAEELIGPEEQVLARMQVPTGVTIEPGVTVAFYVRVTPTSTGDDAVVSESEVSYRSGSRNFRELVKLKFVVPSSNEC
jgi:hypothetical protein